jgi:hypothetical protein
MCPDFFGTSDTTHVILIPTSRDDCIPTRPDVSGQVGKNLHPIQKHIKGRFFARLRRTQNDILKIPGLQRKLAHYVRYYK